MRKFRRFFYDTEFIEQPNTIDLISIGVVSEDGTQEFYEECGEFDESKASDWVKENVIAKLTKPDHLRVTKDHLAVRLLKFLSPTKTDPIQLWAYYADYDHVVTCWLWGPMIKLPPGIQMYTMDIKQLAMHVGNPKLPAKAGDEHNALEDAKWNREAYLFLKEHAKKKRFKLNI
jgi:hypothetical protein